MSRFECFAHSEPSGIHETNEDYVSVDSDAGVFVIADGLGGRPGGALASRVAVKAFLKQLHRSARSLWLDEYLLSKAMEAANKAILARAKQKSNLVGMGTTLTVLILNGNYGKIIHVGDSRVYRVAGDRPIQLTQDHTLVSELIQRRLLDESKAGKYPLRHVLSKVIGVREAVEPDFIDVTLASTQLMIMATDGLTRALTDKHFTEITAEYNNAGPEALCRALFLASQQKTLKDDLTIVVLGTRE